MKIVKCKKCGTEYEMPDIGQEVIMEDCPVCKDIDKQMKKILGEAKIVGEHAESDKTS